MWLIVPPADFRRRITRTAGAAETMEQFLRERTNARKACLKRPTEAAGPGCGSDLTVNKRGDPAVHGRKPALGVNG